MKMVYDARWVPIDGKFDGIGRYSHELAWGLATIPNLEIIWLVRDTAQLAILPARPHIIGTAPDDIWKERFKLPKILRAAAPDVVYSPFFIAGLARSKHYKLITTIHDTIFFRYRTPPQWLGAGQRFGWRLFHLSKTPMRMLLNRATAVATVSDTVHQELLDWKLTKRPILTVKNAVSESFRRDVTLQGADDRSQSKIILHHGAVTPYKNVEVVIDALPYMPEITLHIMGKIPPVRMKELAERITRVNVANRVVIHNGVTEEQLRSFLSVCRALVSPSRIEGFGLPVIEAQMRGAPVICSDIPIYREIGGDSVLYFSPDSPEQCADAVHRLANAELNRSLIAAGQQNAARYTWQASAQVVADYCWKLTSAGPNQP